MRIKHFEIVIRKVVKVMKQIWIQIIRTYSDAFVYKYLSTPPRFVPWFASIIAHCIFTTKHFCFSDLETFM